MIPSKTMGCHLLLLAIDMHCIVVSKFFIVDFHLNMATMPFVCSRMIHSYPPFTIGRSKDIQRWYLQSWVMRNESEHQKDGKREHDDDEVQNLR